MEPIRILYVEDNAGDILLFTDAIEESNISYVLNVVKNGYEALDFLNKKDKYSLAEMPHLILLDINMPGMNGLELLELIKTNDQFKHLTVIMFTSSSSKNDILLAYRKYANSYIVKPYMQSELTELIEGIKQYWGKLAMLPM
jgi:CheY-like chemotaxis protein